jgi:methylmalonyl-CoA/ethylmalonyl-CoA epimerase
MTNLSTIGQIAMVVKDLPRAVTFYRDVLGITFLFQAPPALAFFDCGGVRLMLDAAAEGEFNHPGSILYFRIDDMDATYADLTSKGVPFHSAPHMIAKLPDHELWMAFFRDGEGNTLALMHEKRR